MIFSSPIPRAKQPGFHEGSSQRSIRDTDSTSRQWLKARTAGSNQGGTDNGMRFIIQQINRTRRRVLGGGNSSASLSIGEYDPAKSYAAQAIVFFTPDGGSAGAYLALQAVAAGVSPDTGSPNWFAWPNSPPGMFA